MSYERCLCCGEPLLGEEEKKTGWHHACLRRFFGTDQLPLLDFNNAVFTKLASAAIADGRTIAGVQKKLSAHLEKGGRNRSGRLTIIGYPLGYIVKPQSDEYKHLPEMEQTVMLLAKEATINVVPHGLLPLSDGSLCYITKRVDRFITAHKTIKIPMEDFCQIAGLPEDSKYRGSYELCGEIIQKYSSVPLLDKTNLFKIVYFSFITGNSDMHLKNFSFLCQQPNKYVLSPSYDLLCTRIAIPSDKEDLALNLNGKKMNLSKKDFDKFAESLGLSQIAENKIMKAIQDKMTSFATIIKNGYMNESQKNELIHLMKTNIRRSL